MILDEPAYKPIARFTSEELRQAKAENAKYLRLARLIGNYNSSFLDQLALLIGEPTT